MADRTPSTPPPHWRQLRNSGLAVLGVGIVGTVLLALLHGGLHWTNSGFLVMISGAVIILRSVHRWRADAREDASSPSR